MRVAPPPRLPCRFSRRAGLHIPHASSASPPPLPPRALRRSLAPTSHRTYRVAGREVARLGDHPAYEPPALAFECQTRPLRSGPDELPSDPVRLDRTAVAAPVAERADRRLSQQPRPSVPSISGIAVIALASLSHGSREPARSKLSRMTFIESCNHPAVRCRPDLGLGRAHRERIKRKKEVGYSREIVSS